MILSNKFYKYVLLPTYYVIHDNPVLRRLNELEISQNYELNEIKNIQFRSLKKLLLHAYNNVEFYKKRFDAVNFNPNNFKNISEYNRIPYLTKYDIQNNLSQLIAKNYSKEDLITDSSGGSTGKPTNFYKDTYRHKIRRADQYRHDRWSGWDLGEKYVALWGAQREFDSKVSMKTKIIERYIQRVYTFNAFDISEENALKCINNLKYIRPSMILSYANVAYLFANIIHSHRIDTANLKIKGVISSAESLDSEKRDVIESAFQCKVFNRYGSREVGLIASECNAQEGLHINSENIFLEIQNHGKETDPEEVGEVIVTDLWNYGMPFIRYQLGDVAAKSKSPCSCGRGLPMLKEVTGRVSDFIVDTRGRLIHGEYFTHLFYGVNNVKQFQFVQESMEHIILNIRPMMNFNPLSLDPIVEKIKLCLGANVKVDIIIHNESLVETSGKFRFTVSNISSNYFRNT